MQAIPNTTLVKEAFSLAKAVLSPSVFNHSMRTYHLGCAYANKYRHNYDAEEFLLAALFHDLGLFSPYRISGKPFQIGSSEALKKFLLQDARIAPERINVMMEAIDFHFRFVPNWNLSETAGILQTGAHMDVTGSKSRTIEKSVRKSILQQYPKNRFMLDFSACLLKTISNTECLKGLFWPEKHVCHNHYLSI
jgi:HD superfamily phosphodiesterase